MRIPAISFLLLAMSLPVLAHPDREAYEYRHPWKHRRMVTEDFGPRFEAERPPWGRSRRMILHEPGSWCGQERGVVFVPAPPRLLLRPRVRLWIGF